MFTSSERLASSCSHLLRD